MENVSRIKVAIQKVCLNEKKSLFDNTLHVETVMVEANEWYIVSKLCVG